MATEAQRNANRANAQQSTGPRTPEGRARSSRNAVLLGLFSTSNCVRPHETEEYETLVIALWNDIRPQSPLQELFATEIARATWRLRRCAEVESALAEKTTGDPMLDNDLLRTQTAVDRARSQSHSIIRRSLAEIRRLKTEQPVIEAPTKRTETSAPASIEIGRNSPCPCHSGQKYKRCCGRNAPAILHRAA
jgi:hypothetical protein